MTMRRSGMGMWCGVSLLLVALPSAVFANETPVYSLTLKGHRFDPAALTIPAGKRVKLVVQNKDAQVEEFESHGMQIEKLVNGGKSISVFVGPLKPGNYDFFGERHEDTARGTLIAE